MHSLALQAAVSANTDAMSGLVREWLQDVKDRQRGAADGERANAVSTCTLRME